MNSFYQGQLRHFTEKLRRACATDAMPSLPEVLADTTPVGHTARHLLTELPVSHQEHLASYCITKLAKGNWIKSQPNQEAVKVVLDEVCVSALGSAQELGLAFVSALGRVEASWMRILVNLELAELLSRTHVYAPSCAVAYVRTFQNFEDYFDEGEFTRGPLQSLFEPLALAHGDHDLARTIALQSVLPFGEDALRLLWGLQARDQDQGNVVGAKVLRVEEEWLAERLTVWLRALQESPHHHPYPWCQDLDAAIQRSLAHEGPAQVRLRDTDRSRAVEPFIEDVQSLMNSGYNREAMQLLSLLTPALARDKDLESTTLKNHYLQSGYLRAVALFRIGCSQNCQEQARQNLQRLWGHLERSYNEPGSLWPKTVSEARRAAIHEIPKDWRFSPIPFPI